MPHQGNSPADIIGYDGQGRPIYKGHTSSNGVRVRNGYFDTLYGSGANLTNVNATTLDSIDSGSFLRSDAADVMSQSSQGTATLDVRNTGGAGSGTGTGAIIAKFWIFFKISSIKIKVFFSKITSATKQKTNLVFETLTP